MKCVNKILGTRLLMCSISHSKISMTVFDFKFNVYICNRYQNIAI